jgi:hypothetical protein
LACLQPILEKIWNEGEVPPDWKKGLIVKLPEKGDTTNCNSWQGITLLTVPSKVVFRIILNRVKDVVELHLLMSRLAFVGISCVDLINNLRIILEQSAEWHKTLRDIYRL